MNIVSNYIQKYPLRTQQILGITYEQFQSLVKVAQTRHSELELEKENKKLRINAAGGGRPQKLLSSEQICLCLFYFRQIPTFEILGMLFSVSKTEANDTFHYWRQIIREILPSSLIEQVSHKESDLMIVQEILTTFNLLVDTMGQPMNRPSDNNEQEKYYSGKKQQHTRKNQLITLPEGEDIVDVEVGFPGPIADVNIFRQQQNKFLKKQGFTGDKAYQGGNNITTPHKKKPKRELSEKQKLENK